MARITRKELKTDKFAEEVGQTVNFFEEHRREILRYSAVVAVLAVIGVAVSLYMRQQHANRQAALARAIQVQETPVGPSQSGTPSFPTPEAKSKEATRAFTEVESKYSGSAEGAVASYYLGCILADEGKLAEAEKRFQKAAEKGDAKYASLAKLSLAQIYFADGRSAQGEKLLRDLIDHPTVFVSKEQATVSLARALMRSKPAEAKKLLEPLRTSRDAVTGVALPLYTELSQ